MEILFIWIDEYKSILKQGFNFSPVLKFKYSPKNKLQIINNNLDSEYDFFSNKKKKKVYTKDQKGNIIATNMVRTHYPVSNVTAIVGENGSGKSSLLDFIKYELTPNQPWEKNHEKDYRWLDNLYKNILIFRFNKKIILAKSQNQTTIFFEITSKNLKQHEIDIHSLDEINFDWKTDNKYRLLPSTIVFYSNFFDGRSEIEKKGLVNLSTNFLIRKDKERYEVNKGWGKKFSHEWMQVNPIETHKIKEIERQLSFLSNICYNKDYEDIKDKLDFIPKNLIITIDSNREKEKLPILIKKISFIKNEEINRLLNFLSTFDKSIKQAKEDVKDGIELLRIQFNETLFYREIRKCLRDVNATSLIDFFSSIESQPWNVRVQMTINRFNESEYDKGKYQRILEYLEKQDIHSHETLYNREKNKYIPTKIAIIVKTSTFNDKIKNLGDFFRQYQHIVGYNSHFLDFSWRGLSTGELTLFNIFSRFHSILYKDGTPPHYPGLWRDNLIILIDEGELGFHPNWQREYLDLLLEVLTKKDYIDSKDTIAYPNGIQLILTTHSPFIISDLPQENIIFLKKDTRGNCMVTEGLLDTSQTFGANIHTLLTDSFFMSSLLGKFAEKKINEIINNLNQYPSNLLIEDFEKIKMTVSKIGEPILRKFLFNKIEEIENHKSKNDIENLRNRIKSLESQIKTYKAIENDKN